MLSAKSLFQEILDNDESYRLFCSIAASGEAQGGWENARIAALLPPELAELAPKVTRHGADEAKHGRIFAALLRKRDLTPCDVPEAADYTMLLETRGVGLRHDRLRQDEPLTVAEVIAYLAHSRVTEQRASEQMRLLRKHFAGRPDIGRAVQMIAADETNHLAYCHAELLCLEERGHRQIIRRMLGDYASVEIEVYRDVGLTVVAQMASILRWPRAKVRVLEAGIHANYRYEHVAGWRRLVSLRPPPPNVEQQSGQRSFALSE